MNCVIINNEPISAFIQESILQRSSLLTFCGKYNCFDDFYRDLNISDKGIDLVIITDEMYRHILSDRSVCDSFIYTTMITKYMVLFDKYAELESNIDENYKNVHFYNSPISIEDLPIIINDMIGAVSA